MKEKYMFSLKFLLQSMFYAKGEKKPPFWSFQKLQQDSKTFVLKYWYQKKGN